MGWRKTIKTLRRGYNNAAEIVRLGRLTDPHRTPFDVAHADRIYSLRRYHGIERAEAGEGAAPVLLIPPLMVTSEIYDMAPDVSSTSYLLGQGLDVWVVDFGAPERIEGGMNRTLDDHVRAVSEAVDFVADASGQDVHIAGYSQGGMFCYQAAAYRRSARIASIITFGSPVDIYRNLPIHVSQRVAEKVFGGLRQLIERPLTELDGLPGFLTSFGFKMVSPKKEAEQVLDFVAKLHDRQALEKRESRRRFLGGEGFVAWPGPALRTFVDEYIVANRMASGGFVIDGRSVSLADLTCPILYFVGLRDDIARPASVRAIKSCAFNAETHEVGIRAGHLGLVVGSRSLAEVWPTVVSWVGWVDRGEELPARIRADQPSPIDDVDDEAFDDLDLDLEEFYDFASDSVQDIFSRLTRAGNDITDTIDALRWQLPRLTRLRNIRADTLISSGSALAEQAEKIPDATFFLWRGRAFSYADADRRVNAVVRGLLECGVEPGQRVGVLMRPRPTYLSIVTAVNRLGAVAVLLSPDMGELGLERALSVGEVEHLVADPDNAGRAREAFDGPVLALGGPYGKGRTVPEGVRDMEAIDVAQTPPPAWYSPNPGRAADEALILFTAGRAEEPRAARITNRRWAFSALGAAAGCTLTPNDTVYCVLPLHHAAGILVAVGGALIGGSRLALAPGFSPAHFWSEVRRYGATVVFYAGEMCRQLVDAPNAPSDTHNPVRIFAGSGMRRDVWERLRQRFKVGVLEFYATTEGNAVLANASGKKVGAFGQPLPGATDMSIVAYDFRTEDFVRDEQGFLQRCGVDRPGMLIARVDRGHPMAGFDGYVGGPSRARIMNDVFEPGDCWFLTRDLLRQDAEGTYWFVDRLSDVVRTETGPVFTREVEDLIYRRSDVRMLVVHAWASAAPQEVALTVVPRGDYVDLDRLGALIDEKLERRARPRYVRFVDHVSLSDGYRPLKRALIDARGSGARKVYVRRDEGFVPWVADAASRGDGS